MIKKRPRVTVDLGDGALDTISKDIDIDKTRTSNAELNSVNETFSQTHIEGEPMAEDAGEVEDVKPEVAEVPPPLSVEEFFAVHDAGAVDLAFPEHLEYETSPECYPQSYYTLSGKERLLLLFAENFRKQFHALFPDRRPLVLAIINECDVQKLVCTTIRPTSFLFPSLIASLEGCASFVADFIEYTPLENPGALPPRLVSPTTLLRTRKGNSFEMATLLCSMLIGAGFPAMVVSGAARIETINNDQRNEEYPLPEGDDPPIDDEEGVTVEKSMVSDKYKLKPKPDLLSHLTEKMEQLTLEKEARERHEKEEAARIEREALDDELSFNDPYRRSHAWVAIVNNAPWSIKPRTKIIDEEGEEVDAPPSVTFIEPSTGFTHETNTKAYIHIESVWNHLNYYVNLQKCRIREMNWDLRETSEWEHFLAGEPPEMRVAEEISDENLAEEVNKVSVEKHLDMSRSWVQKLSIGEKEFDEKFPQLYKAVYYKRVLHERFSSHSKVDGRVEQLISYSDDNYEVPVVRWTWYNSRTDLMIKLKFFFATGNIEEYFLKGRPDSLKYFIHNADNHYPKTIYFFSTPRLDSLRYCKVHQRMVVLHFEKFPGKCFYKEFVTKAYSQTLRAMKEKFQRNPLLPADKDIASRTFLLSQRKILLKFHYVRGALTATTREFTKPPNPDYGQEIIFNPALTKGFKYGDTHSDPTQLELYLLLLEQLKAEEAAKKAFYKHLDELNRIFEHRKREMEKTILLIRCFDSLRNAGARKIRIAQDAKEASEKSQRWTNLPDFLAPYLVPYNGRVLTQEESCTAYNSCLNGLKTRFVSLLNELQRRYEDLTAEAQSLKKFLNKFQNKFDGFDYERLLQESKDLELNKRMVQKRLTITHEEAQKKYDLVKQSLLKDERLNLK